MTDIEKQMMDIISLILLALAENDRQKQLELVRKASELSRKITPEDE